MSSAEVPAGIETQSPVTPSHGSGATSSPHPTPTTSKPRESRMARTMPCATNNRQPNWPDRFSRVTVATSLRTSLLHAAADLVDHVGVAGRLDDLRHLGGVARDQVLAAAVRRVLARVVQGHERALGV